MTVKKGDTVKVDYEGSLDDGTIFDSSKKHDSPLEFKVGSGQVIKGFDDAVIGMEKNEEKDFKIEAGEAYGEHNPQLLKKVPREQMPKGQELKAGMILGASMPNGAQMPAKITEVTDDYVTVDLNHPLAGKALNFRIKVLEIIS